jgi:hypothetical protein
MAARIATATFGLRRAALVGGADEDMVFNLRGFGLERGARF